MWSGVQTCQRSDTVKGSIELSSASQILNVQWLKSPRHRQTETKANSSHDGQRDSRDNIRNVLLHHRRTAVCTGHSDGEARRGSGMSEWFRSGESDGTSVH